MKKIYNFCEKVITLVLLVGIGIFGIFQVYAITTSQQIDTAATKIEQILRGKSQTNIDKFYDYLDELMDKYRQSRDSNRLITLMRLKDSLNTKIPKSTDTDIIKTDICPILLVNPCFNQGGYYIRRGWPDCGFVCLDEETGSGVIGTGITVPTSTGTTQEEEEINKILDSLIQETNSGATSSSNSGNDNSGQSGLGNLGQLLSGGGGLLQLLQGLQGGLGGLGNGGFGAQVTPMGNRKQIDRLSEITGIEEVRKKMIKFINYDREQKGADPICLDPSLNPSLDTKGGVGELAVEYANSNKDTNKDYDTNRSTFNKSYGVSEVEQFFMKNNPTCSKIVKEKPGEEEKEPKCVGIGFKKVEGDDTIRGTWTQVFGKTDNCLCVYDKNETICKPKDNTSETNPCYNPIKAEGYEKNPYKSELNELKQKNIEQMKKNGASDDQIKTYTEKMDALESKLVNRGEFLEANGNLGALNYEMENYDRILRGQNEILNSDKIDSLTKNTLMNQSATQMLDPCGNIAQISGTCYVNSDLTLLAQNGGAYMDELVNITNSSNIGNYINRLVTGNGTLGKYNTNWNAGNVGTLAGGLVILNHLGLQGKSITYGGHSNPALVGGMTGGRTITAATHGGGYFTEVSNLNIEDAIYGYSAHGGGHATGKYAECYGSTCYYCDNNSWGKGADRWYKSIDGGKNWDSGHGGSMADSQDYKDTIEKNKKNFADEMKNQGGECKQEV